MPIGINHRGIGLRGDESRAACGSPFLRSGDRPLVSRFGVPVSGAGSGLPSAPGHHRAGIGPAVMRDRPPDTTGSGRTPGRGNPSGQPEAWKTAVLKDFGLVSHWCPDPDFSAVGVPVHYRK